MSSSGNTYVQLIQGLKLEKIETLEEIRTLKDELDTAQHTAYSVLLKLNAEIANKYFKEVDHEVPFNSRIKSAVTLMVINGMIVKCGNKLVMPRPI